MYLFRKSRRFIHVNKSVLLAVAGLVAFWYVIYQHKEKTAPSVIQPRPKDLPLARLVLNSKQQQDNQRDKKCAELRQLVHASESKIIAGRYMEQMKIPRDRAFFSITPWAVENDVQGKACKTEKESVLWSMVSLVKSSLGHRDRREAIRKTWGSVKVLNKVRFEVVFIVGLTNGNASLQNQLEEEGRLNGDLLQFNLNDTAESVPEKVLAGMQWASMNMPPESLYNSMDDDVMLNLPKLVEYFNDLMRPGNNNASGKRPCSEDLPLVCMYSYQPKDKPARDPKSKWYMPLELFPNETWPTYCRGGLYTAPVKMVTKLYEASRKTDHLYLDDVWITGFMRRKLGKGDWNIMPAPRSERVDEKLMEEATIIAPVDEALMQHLWGNINFKTVDVPSRIFQVWETWKKALTLHEVCETPNRTRTNAAN
uniref:Hexosyltransferase n=1 Tax=Ciona intestinalis TaxID=7719 RepID=F6ZZ57_CIOIN|nr:lactosylceramide 1,3-N-acetyl-beta-D-glucosaminyltransferase-like isoform X2 [Ciona intestinalis]XP_026694411.1 lactosylceramide 1,3-N-acetyl-beta-D-glucosaminyltransferase-like isoform X2 [Ciona intestinalis]|eukprot:XP_026694410.1 lactosylceramide 1,3-N-acetyl-beta-D-glucosaminyltransferase-like isoform X2 [Ciona intestinalis]